jgi:hypothetical protein
MCFSLVLQDDEAGWEGWQTDSEVELEDDEKHSNGKVALLCYLSASLVANSAAALPPEANSL